MAIARIISLKSEVIFFRAIFFLIVSYYCVVASVRLISADQRFIFYYYTTRPNLLQVLAL